MKKMRISCAFFCFLSCACSNRDLYYGTASDKTITVEITRMTDPPGEEGKMMTFKARLTPSKTAEQSFSKEVRNALLYGMDSCFYIQSNGVPLYPALVQNVASGVKGKYEFLLEFDRPTMKKDSLLFIYSDRYITRKKYHLNYNESGEYPKK